MNDPAEPSRAARLGIIFQPSGRRGPASEGQTILDAARDLGVDIESICGGKGTCRKCIVRVESDSATVSGPSDIEMKALGPTLLDTGMRLACQTRTLGDVRVFVPEESRRVAQIVRKEAGSGTVPVDPAIKAHRATLIAPTLEDATADGERLLAALEREHALPGLEFDLGVLQRLPSIARTGGWDLRACVWNDRMIVDVRAAADTRPILGLALDIGTTTLAAYLTDLESGEVRRHRVGDEPASGLRR